MKSKFVLVILALVILVHALIFLFPIKKREEEPKSSETPTELSKSDSNRSDQTTAAPIQRSEGTPPREDGAAETPQGESVDRAVSLVKRAEASTPRPEPNQPLSPNVEVSETSEPLRMGVVTGNSKLPPELKELATEGAEAVASQNWSAAREIYLEMVQKAPDNALAYANLGVSEHQLGNLLAAAGNLRKSLELNPSIAQNWQTLGLIHYKRRELELAISHLTRAIHEDPSDARTRLYLAAVIREYGWDDAAVTELERAIETDPELADAHYNLAVSYLDESPPRIELARRHYYAAIDLGAEPSPELESVFQKPIAKPVAVPAP